MALRFFTDILSSNEALGLNVGAGTVRAVRLVKSEKGFEIIDSVSTDFQADRPAHPAEIEAALREAARLIMQERTRLVGNVRALSSRLHFFDLPFGRSDKIRQALPYIIEPLVMARVEDLLFDYLPLTENALKGEPAIAFAAEPEAVSSAMENIQAAGLNPDTILPDSLGLIAVGKYLFQGDPPHRSRLILDLGASQTGMALFHQGRAITSRTVPFGGLNLTQALAEAQNRDMSEAEALKRKTGLGDKETSEAAAILREAWQLLIAEIERTLAASLTDPDEPAPIILLTGGGAHTLGLPQFLSTRLGLEVQVLNREADITNPLPGLEPELVTTAGLAILGITPRTRPNLRQGELAPQQALARHRKPLILMACGLLLIALISLGSLVLDYRHQNRRYNEVKSEINRIFKDASPETTRIVSPLAQLRQKVEQARSGVTGLTSERRRVLNLILEISRVAKTREGMRLLEFSLTTQTLELQWEGGNFEDLDRLKTELVSLPFFSEVTVGGAKMDPVTRKLTFKLTLKRQAK
ncbi:MAG: pilus assembly protein PilM [Deltaproteobacteria bacterium]|nr:pilus assembly protein PilM [Deltaproteobacteria bacterium]MBW2052194.1 pilus assembly protein PilM [Deltaproteobacteria bacterium]MBW2140765.1 pilus assembly protein PilM [Deltaproteobacteria bacterium]